MFSADWGDGHFIGVVRVLDRLLKAKLEGCDASRTSAYLRQRRRRPRISELTIAGLLGHSARGVTQGYVHLDTALVVAADRVSAGIAELLDGVASGTQRKKGPRNVVASALAA